MPPPSVARQFYEDITGAPNPAAFIRGLVNSTPPTFETDWLDFKQQPQPGDLRGKWIEALSGFANNQGGVIVWGLDARKDPTTNIDAANRVVPVRDPFAFKTRLIQLQRESTDPPLMNVEHEAYEDPPGSGAGFVVSFIPQGTHQPYRTVDGRDSQFFLRTGDSFFVMGRPMLASMFYPRTRVRFRACGISEIVWSKPGGSETQVQCRVFLTNTGTATARDMAVRVAWKMPGKFAGKDCGGRIDRNLPEEVLIRWHDPLHPGVTEFVFQGGWELSPDLIRHLGVGFVPGGPPPQIGLTVYCDNQQPQSVVIPVDMQAVVEGKRVELAQDCEDME